MTTHPVEQLSALLDGELGDADRRAVFAHVAACASCARDLRELTAVDALARGLPPAAAPDGYLDALPGRVRRRIRAERPFAARRPWILPLAAGIVLAVLAPIVLREQTPKTIAPAAAAAAADEKALARPQAPPPAVPAVEGKLARAQTREAPQRQQAAAPQKARDAFVPAPPPAAPTSDKNEADLAARGEGGVVGEEPLEAAAHRNQDRARATGAMAERADAPASSKKAAAPEESRRRRDAWRRFVETHPAGPRADEARVRAIEAGIEAYRLGGDEADRALALRDIEAYLARPDAAQTAHVQAIAGPLRAAPR